MFSRSSVDKHRQAMSPRKESGHGREGALALMDGLRGLALFGILLVNISAMAAPSMAYGGFAL